VSPLSAPSISRLLSYQPPYDWPAILRFLAARAIPGMEAVSEERYQRVVNVRDTAGWIEITHVPGRRALALTLHHPDSEALPAVTARVRHLFDLDLDPAAVGEVLRRDPFLAPLVTRRPGLRVPGAWDHFEVAVRAVLGQQITVKAATRLAGKLVATLGAPIPHPVDCAGLTHAFPRPERFQVDEIAALGMPRARAATLAGLATAVRADDAQLFKRGRDVEETVAKLRTLPGIGEWTAQYIAMRALRETDAFLAGDVALQRLLAHAGQRPSPRELLARAERWRPWRAYAVLHVWTAGADVEADAP
jgi:AraC family transcriptional regulator of adaptative response / DNA-3-methyladenine glycosylase II